MNSLQGHSSTNTLSSYNSSELSSPTKNSQKSALKENFPLKDLNIQIQKVKELYKPFVTPKGSSKTRVSQAIKNTQAAQLFLRTQELQKLENSKTSQVAQVSFDRTKKIILIPTNNEYLNIGINRWLSEDDLESYMTEARFELSCFLQSHQDHSPKDAIRALYQPH